MPGCCGTDSSQLSDLIDDAAAHPLDTMPLERMSDLMPITVANPAHSSSLENTGEDRDFAAGQTKRVHHLVFFDDRKFPLILRLIGRLGNPLPYRWTNSLISTLSLSLACRKTSRYAPSPNSISFSSEKKIS